MRHHVTSNTFTLSSPSPSYLKLSKQPTSRLWTLANLSPSVEEHQTLPVEKDLNRPLAKTATRFPQVNPGRLSTGEKLRKLL
jgi:hypothetical protein